MGVHALGKTDGRTDGRTRLLMDVAVLHATPPLPLPDSDIELRWK